jgi:hypothetical protein
MVACLAATRSLYELGELDEATSNVERGLEIAEQLGADRFKPFLTIFLAHILWAKHGPREDIDAIMEQAAQTSRATSSGFLGPWVMGTQALVSDDPEKSRQALKTAEEILAGDCVGHNYFALYRIAMEVSLRLQDWDEVNRFADALQSYSRPEPLPRTDFYIARARTLARFGRGERDDSTIRALRRLRDEAEQLELMSALPGLQQALREEGQR